MGRNAKMKRRKLFAGLTTTALAALLFLYLAGPASAGKLSGKLVIFHAGSLSVPFEKIEKDFENKYPGVDVVRKSGGSTKMARLISEKGEQADIMGSADFKVIDKNLIPAHAGWNIRFATNQLVLCYTDKSRFANEINADNWYRILARKGVQWGHSDPNLDPCGYRSLMALQLAEIHYGRKGLSDELIANRPQENVRRKAVELVSMLKNGELDYGWEYLSVAVQHNLRYVKLPDRINLGNYQYDAFYGQAAVKVAGKAPGTWITRKGKSITYGITMIKNGPNPAAAIAFLDYLLNPALGLKVLRSMGQPPITPCRVSSEKEKSLLPPAIAQWVEVKK
jgi:molybdate/tungstate transport system substrate-binding protein